MKIVTAKELDAFTSNLINLRFSVFMMRLADELNIDRDTMRATAKQVLTNAEIPQD